MKVFSRIFSLIIALVIITSFSLSTSAKEVEISDTSLNSPVSALAYDIDTTGTMLESDSTLPSYYSSKDNGYTTDVRSQLYNACWAYGALATLESTALKLGIQTEHFSPMHANHWGTQRADGTGWNRDYYSGGYSYISLGYLSSWQGPLLESDYPELTDQSQYDELSKNASKQLSVNGIIYLDTRDIDTVKTAVYNHAAVLANYHVNDNYHNYDTNAYFCNEENLTTAQLNGHAISIVGWDDNFKKENFNEIARPENDGAWLCKNSWGIGFGDEGYYYISYEDSYLFDTRFGHSYAFTDINVYNNAQKLYQNEIDGATYEFSYANAETITYINVFDKDLYFDTIDKVNFETVSQGALYNIYNIPLNENSVPTKDKSKWRVLSSGIIPYEGYHSIDTEDFTVNSDKFAIGVELTSNKGSGNSIGVSEWLTSGNKKIFIPQSTYGMSYIQYDDINELDVMDFYKQALDDDIGGTFVIKAVAKETEFEIGDVDLDKKVTVMDATAIQQHIAQIKIFNEKQLSLADTDKDNNVSIMDATVVQMKVAGLLDNSGDEFEDSDFEELL